MFNSLLGMTIIEAVNALKIINFTIRSIKVNGEDNIVTDDIKVNRVNVEINNGLITKVCSVG